MFAFRKFLALFIIAGVFCAFLSPPGHASDNWRLIETAGGEVVRQEHEVRMESSGAKGASASSLSSMGAGISSASSSTAEEVIPGDVLVVLTRPSGTGVAGVSAVAEKAKTTAVATSAGGRVEKVYSALSRAGGKTFALIHSDTKNEGELLESLQDNTNVLGVSLNYKTRAFEAPNDPKYSQLWGMPAISADRLWNEGVTGGNNVYVAVMDTGVAYDHEDLAANFEQEGYSRNFSTTEQSAYYDGDGHGSHVSGTIAGVGNNSIGVVGVNWKAKIIALKVLDDTGHGQWNWTTEAMNYLCELVDSHPELHIASVNLSLGGYIGTSPEDMISQNNPMWAAFKAFSDKNRAVICVAAGNESIEVGKITSSGTYCYPASFRNIDNMIVVGAADNNSSYSKAYYSNYSTEYVSISAPGSGILSTLPGNSYASYNGTSMATPHVAGAAALIASEHPNANASDIKAALVGGANAKYAKSYTANGFLDVRKALQILDENLGSSVPPEITVKELAKAYINESYSAILHAKGAKPITWTLVSGTIPPGLALNSAEGKISGTPTSSGSYTFRVRATNAHGSDTEDISITVSNGRPEITVSLLEGSVQELYSAKLTAKGETPITWSLSGGSLPPYLTLNTDGTISGAPSKPGDYEFTVTARNSIGSDSKLIKMKIAGVKPMLWNLPYITGLVVGKSYKKQFETMGTGPVEWSITEGTLPPGLSLSPSSGLVSGTPTTAGSYYFTLKVKNSEGEASHYFYMYVDDLTTSSDITILTEKLPQWPRDLPYAMKLDAYAPEPVTWTLEEGSLISGVSFDKSGVISGLYTINLGSYRILKVKASNSSGSVSKHMVFWWACNNRPTQEIITESLPDAVVGENYSKYIEMTGFSSYVYDIADGELPPGMVLTENGYIKGTPSRPGTYTFTVRGAWVCDTWDLYDKREFTLNVRSSGKAKPEIITTELPDGIKGFPYNKGLSFTGTDSISWSYNGTIPPGLYLSSGHILGTPTQAGEYTFTVTASNTAGSSLKTFTVKIHADSVKPEVTSATLPNATQGASYDVNLTASGTPPVVWAFTEGRLPAGIRLTPEGNLTGTAEESGSFNATFKAYNAYGSNGKSFTLNSDPAGKPVIATDILPLAVTGIPYTARLEAPNSPQAKWSIAGGLPSWMAGLSLSENGVISGTPTYDTWGTEGISGGILVRAENSTGTTLKYITFTLNSEGLLPETFGDAYMRHGKKDIRNLSNDIRGGLVKGTSYNVLMFRNFRHDSTMMKSISSAEITSGKLPGGMTLSYGDYCPIISGTPSKTGTYTFTLRAYHGYSNAYEEKIYTVEVKQARDYGVPVIIASTLPDGAKGQEYIYSLTAEALSCWEPAKWTVTSGTIPPGLQIEDGDILTGTPTTAGTYAFTLQAEGPGGKASKAVTLKITSSPSAPTVSTLSLPNGYKGSWYRYVLTASGTRSVLGGSSRWGIVSGIMPPGLTLNSEGEIIGTPSATGTWTFKVYARNTWGSSEKSLTLTIIAPSSPVISQSSLPDARQGEPYSADITASGPEPVKWSVTGLPSGMSFIRAGTTRNIRVYGTPPSSGTYYPVFTASNISGSTSKTLTLVVKVLPPVIATNPPLPYARKSSYYSYTLQATGAGSITWSKWSGSLPAGMYLNTTTGNIYGTPTAEGTSTFTVKAKNAGGESQPKTFSISVLVAPSITTSTLPYAKTNTAYSFDIQATGTKPIRWTVSGLPSGMNYTTKGHVGGIPSKAGTYSVTLKAVNSLDITAQKTLTLQVAEKGVEINAANFPDSVFRDYVKGFDTDNDGWIDSIESGKVSSISVVNKGISSLKGIEHFTALTYLQCSSNKLTALDVSKNTALKDLRCYSNQITALDVSKNTALTYLDAESNKLTKLDVSKNTLLQTLWFDNNQLTAIDLSKNTALQVLYANINRLTTLDVSKNTALTYLNCGSNKLTTIDLSKNTALQTLHCYSNQLTTLDVSKNTALKTLQCYSNKLTALDLTNCTAITSLSCNSQYPKNLITAKKSDDVYYVDFNRYAPGNLSKLSGIYGLSGVSGGTQITAVYDPSTGKAKFSTLPKRVDYMFDTARTNLTNRYMSVQLAIPAEPIIVTDYVKDAEDGKAYSFALEATADTTKPISWDISAGKLPSGLSLGTTTGKITGTPNETGKFTFTVRARTPDGNGTKSLSMLVKAVPPSITTSTLTDGAEGASYSAELKASGTKPLTWSITSGKLPKGLSLSSAGKITGIPEEYGSFNFTVKASNSAGNASKSLKLTVAQALTVAAQFPEYIVVGGVPPYKWEVVSGTKPASWTLSYTNPGSRVRVSINPPTTPGIYDFTMRVTDSKGTYADDKRKITVSSPSVVGSMATSLPMGDYYSTSLTASGGLSPYKWTVTSGKLPDGMSLAYTGAKLTIAGKPKQTGTYTFAVTTTDKYGARPSTAKSFTVTVTKTTISDYSSGTMSAASASSSGGSGTVKAKYSKSYTASGGKAPYTWSVNSGPLPEGLTLTQNADGTTATVSGTFTKTGNYTYTLKADDKNKISDVTGSLTLKVTQTAITGNISATATRKASYTATPKASGGASPYTWSVSSGKLPDGLKINASTGKITGTATKAGTFKFTVKAQDKNGAANTKAYTVKVTQTTLAGNIPTSATRKASYTGTPKVSGGASPYKWSVSSGKLPDGLKINASTGKITGTATKAGTFKFTVKAKDKNGAAATKNYTVKVTQTAVSGTLASATKRSSYNATPKASGGAKPYTWSVSSGKLPNGLKLNASSGKITGKATKTGSFTFTLQAKDKNGAAGTKKFTLKVTSAIVASKSSLPESKNALPQETSNLSALAHDIVSSLPAENRQADNAETDSGYALMPSLRVISDDILESYDGRDSDIFTVKAGQTVTFILGGKILGGVVCVDDEPLKGIAISDKLTFTLPAEIVSGDFKVHVKSQDGNTESEEAFIISE